MARRSGRQRRTQHRNLNTSASLLVRKREYLHKPSSSPEGPCHLPVFSRKQRTETEILTVRPWALRKNYTLGPAGAVMKGGPRPKLQVFVVVTMYTHKADRFGAHQAPSRTSTKSCQSLRAQGFKNREAFLYCTQLAVLRYLPARFADAGQLSSASSARNTPRLPRQRQSERVWASPRSAVLGADL